MSEWDGIAVKDRLAVTDRMARYSWAIDSADLDAYLDCFTPDAVLRHPKLDGSPGVHHGHDGIRGFIGRGFDSRPQQSFATQHQFNAVRLKAEETAIGVEAYVMIFRHEFHRQYWPRGSSWRMGTWHARMQRDGEAWRIADVDVRMWNDSAWTTGSALLDRGPGMPGVRD